MAILRPDATTTFGGVTVNEYLLTKHNPNRIDMPSVSMAGKIIGVTVHNTDWISVASGTTPAEQYTRATVNGNMNDVRVVKAANNMHDGIHFSDMRQELVAQAFALGCTAHQTGNVNNGWRAFLIAEIVSVLLSLGFYARINKNIIAPMYSPAE